MAAVTEEGFRAALADPDNRRVMSSAASKFACLDADEREAAGLRGLWRALRGHSEAYSTRFTTSLYRHVRWECLTLLRGGKKESPLPEGFEAAQPTPGDPHLAEHVRHCASRLPGPQREVFEARHFGGLSLRRLAESLGLPPGVARRRLRRAEETFRAVYGSLER